MPFSDRLSYVGYLLDNHIYWTNFFKFLEKETLRDVYYPEGLSFGINKSASADGSLVITTVSRNFDTVTKQNKVFVKSPNVLKVDVGQQEPLLAVNATSTEGMIINRPRDYENAVKFPLTLQLNPNLFLRSQ